MNEIDTCYGKPGKVTKPGIRSLLLAGLAVGMLSGCGADQSDQKPESLAPVKIKVVQPQDITLLTDFTGEVSSAQQVELRSRVSGVLNEKHFSDGDLVERGQLLFSIDDRDFKARLQEARASLSKAEADYTRAKLDVERYEPLLKTQVIARQVYDNAVATMRAARSGIENGKGAVKQALLSVEYASIESPVSGKIGAAEVDIGDLISAGTTLMAEISTVETSWVYFSVSEPQLLAYQRAHGSESVDSGEGGETKVRLIRSDGTMYEHEGVINFADRALNATTGTYRLRAEFPNPNSALRPGMFARIRVATAYEKGVLAVPDKAVSQMLSDYYVVVVEKDEDGSDVARHVSVKVGERQDGLWVVQDGIKAGDRVVVEGIQRAGDGAKVRVTDDGSGSKQGDADGAEASKADDSAA